MTPEELAYLGPLPCLSTVSIPYPDREATNLEFPDQATAADFTAAIYATEFGASGGEAAKFKNGAAMTDESTAYLHAGRFFYVINSWMPEAISAFLEQVE